MYGSHAGRAAIRQYIVSKCAEVVRATVAAQACEAEGDYAGESEAWQNAWMEAVDLRHFLRARFMEANTLWAEGVDSDRFAQ